MNERELLAQGIRRALLLSPMTLAQVAMKLNTGSSTVTKWRDGGSKPTSANLARLSRVLGVEQDVLRAGYLDFAEDAA